MRDFRKITHENIVSVATWCGGSVVEPWDNPCIKLHTGFRVTASIGDVIEKRDDGKWQVWVDGKNVVQDDIPFIPEDRPAELKKFRTDDPLAQAVALVNAGYYQGELETQDVYVVWFCSALSNWKALVSTNVKDNAYYEVTHNGEKKETYVDKYVKSSQMTVPDSFLN